MSTWRLWVTITFSGPLHNWLANLGLGKAGKDGNRGAKWEITVEQTPYFGHLSASQR